MRATSQLLHVRNAKRGPGFLATAAAKIHSAAAIADMAEGGSDDGEFTATSCI